jgi:hypothetical protein
MTSPSRISGDSGDGDKAAKEGQRPEPPDEGTEMPYRWPSGPVVGSRRGLHVIQAISVLLLILLLALLAYMTKMRWG